MCTLRGAMYLAKSCSRPLRSGRSMSTWGDPNTNRRETKMERGWGGSRRGPRIKVGVERCDFKSATNERAQAASISAPRRGVKTLFDPEWRKTIEKVGWTLSEHREHEAETTDYRSKSMRYLSRAVTVSIRDEEDELHQTRHQGDVVHAFTEPYIPNGRACTSHRIEGSNLPRRIEPNDIPCRACTVSYHAIPPYLHVEPPRSEQGIVQYFLGTKTTMGAPGWGPSVWRLTNAVHGGGFADPLLWYTTLDGPATTVWHGCCKEVTLLFEVPCCTTVWSACCSWFLGRRGEIHLAKTGAASFKQKGLFGQKRSGETRHIVLVLIWFWFWFWFWFSFLVLFGRKNAVCARRPHR